MFANPQWYKMRNVAWTKRMDVKSGKGLASKCLLEMNKTVPNQRGPITCLFGNMKAGIPSRAMVARKCLILGNPIENGSSSNFLPNYQKLMPGKWVSIFIFNLLLKKLLARKLVLCLNIQLQRCKRACFILTLALQEKLDSCWCLAFYFTMTDTTAFWPLANMFLKDSKRISIAQVHRFWTGNSKRDARDTGHNILVCGFCCYTSKVSKTSKPLRIDSQIYGNQLKVIQMISSLLTNVATPWGWLQ